MSTGASTARNGKGSARLPRRSAARQRLCAAGYVGPSASADQGSRAGSARVAPGQRDPAQGVRVFCPGGARPPVQAMIAFIDDHRGDYGVEPICKVLPIAPSTYHDHVAKRLDPSRLSARAKRDEAMKVEVHRVFEENFRVY